MDRNDGVLDAEKVEKTVALRKESVDRNKGPEELAQFWSVALRKESVDRNKKMFDEIMQGNPVALRKESVDRNDW